MTTKKTRYKRMIALLSAVILIGAVIVSFIGPMKSFLLHTPRILGFFVEEKNYLVVLQNNAEIRPTGGFISSVMQLTFKNGIPSFAFHNVYGEIAQHDYVEPPYPHKELLGIDGGYAGYTLRDANHSPDFAESAKSLITYFNKTKATPIDGVFAVNFSALERLVEDLGGIEIDGKTVQKDDLFGVMQHSVTNIDRHNEKALDNRKSVLPAIKSALISRALNPWMLRTMSTSLYESLQKRDIMLYFTDEKLQKFAEKKQFAGRFPQYSGGDIIAVNESNLGGAKSNRYIAKNIQYRRTDEPTKNATLSLQLRHLGQWNSPLSTDYKGYFRFYLPPGSSNDIEATIEGKAIRPQNTTEFGYDVVGIVVDPLKMQTEKRIVLRYTNPVKIDKQQYTVRMIHQPGDDMTNVQAAIRFPLGETVIAQPGLTTHEEHAIINTPLNENKTFHIAAKSDELSPRVIVQQFTDLNTIELFFNEPLAKTAKNGFMYEITDLDIKNDKHDKIKIVGIEHGDRRVVLKLSGITRQPEERYRIIMRNIYDLHKNVISPNPKDITVVQRFK